MQEQTKKAFDFAADTTKQLITLSFVLVTAGAAFGKDVVRNMPAAAVWLFAAALISYMLSVIFGILTMQALVGTLQPLPKAEPKAAKSAVSPAKESSSFDSPFGQAVALCVGTLMMFVFALRHGFAPSPATRLPTAGAEPPPVQDEPNEPSIYDGNITVTSLGQVIVFILGTMLLIAFALVCAVAGPPASPSAIQPTTTPASTQPEKPQVEKIPSVAPASTQRSLQSAAAAKF